MTLFSGKASGENVYGIWYNYSMDPEQIRRRQSLKVIVSEVLMTLTVIVTVIALVFVVSGYWLNSDFEIERQGLLQISSVPTGADVTIDGDTSWMQRTNTSKVLKSGEHIVTLTKEGYDSWSKTIDITEGLLYRVRYPRLFLKDRQKESVLSEPGTTLASVSPSNNTMLLINETTKWNLASLDVEPIKTKLLDVSQLFQSTDGNVLTTKITSLAWSGDNSHVLVRADNDVTMEWVLIDINKPENSLNLTKLFGASFEKIAIMDNSATNLVAIREGNLHKINTASKSISAVLSSNVMNFDHYRDTVILSRQKSRNQTRSEATDSTNFSDSTEVESTTQELNDPSELDEQTTGLYEIVSLDLSSEKTTIIKDELSPVMVNISRFYDDIIITTIIDNQVSLYKKEDFDEPFHQFKLSFSPNIIKNSHDSEFIVISNGPQIASVDMEANILLEWSTDGSTYGWLQDDMLYSVNEGKLYVYDADGLNRRNLAENVSSHFPVVITKNKWLYYFSDGSLIREAITD